MGPEKLSAEQLQRIAINTLNQPGVTRQFNMFEDTGMAVAFFSNADLDDEFKALSVQYQPDTSLRMVYRYHVAGIKNLQQLARLGVAPEIVDVIFPDIAKDRIEREKTFVRRTT